MSTRRKFLKDIAAVGTSAVVAQSLLNSCDISDEEKARIAVAADEAKRADGSLLLSDTMLHLVGDGLRVRGDQLLCLVDEVLGEDDDVGAILAALAGQQIDLVQRVQIVLHVGEAYADLQGNLLCRQRVVVAGEEDVLL